MKLKQPNPETGDEAASAHAITDYFGFPKQDGSSQSYWLQSVQGDPLLDHRTTSELPSSADIVIIGSGVRFFMTN